MHWGRSIELDTRTGTTLGRAGVPIRVVQELMRHASLSSTERYLGVDEDEKVAAIGLLR